MTVLVQPSDQIDQPGILRRRVTGTPSEIEATVSLLRHSGMLVSASVPRQVGPTDPRVTVIVRVREDQVPAPRPVPSRRWVKPAVICGSVVAVLGGLIVGGYLAARQIVTTSASGGVGLAALGFLAVVAFLFLVIRSGRKGTCMGLHCSGCGHR